MIAVLVEETHMAEQGIRIAVGQFNELTEEKLRFAAQIGVSGIQLNTPKLPGNGIHPASSAWQI